MTSVVLNHRSRTRKFIICLLLGVVAPIVLAVMLNQAIADTPPTAPAPTNPAVTANPAATATAAAEPTIYDVLVSDQANSGGYITGAKKTTIPASAEAIYVTVEVLSASPGVKVSATLTSSTNISSNLESTITKPGNIMKAFIFKNASGKWPTGNYKVETALSSGSTQEQHFKVQ